MPVDDTSQQLLDNLLAELKTAIPTTFAALSNEFPNLCGFAIGTTVYVEFVVPICQSLDELPDGEESCWERFSPPEWQMMNDRNRNDSFGEGVESARKSLHDHCSDVDDDTSYEIRMAYLDALLSLFSELESSGSFGPKTDQRFLTIWIAGDDEEWIVKSSVLLNTEATHNHLLEQVG